MTAKLQPKKIFKEKKSIKKELLNALENGTKLNFSTLSKAVGISVHRVKKYCKNHNIDLSDYNMQHLQTKKIKQDFDDVMKKTKKTKVQLKTNSTTKINIGLPKEIKISLGNNNLI